MTKLKRYGIIGFLSLISFTTKATDVLDVIQKSEIKYKGIASKVAILETGNFKSNGFRKHNNAFGFKRNSRKLYTRTTKDGYCVYTDVHHSVKDYQMWEQSMIKHHKLHNRSSFLSFLNRVYARTANYSEKLSKIKYTEPIKKSSVPLDSSVNIFLSLSKDYNPFQIKKKLGILTNPQFILSQLILRS